MYSCMQVCMYVQSVCIGQNDISIYNGYPISTHTLKVELRSISTRFNAQDSRGGVAPSLTLTINMCNCSGHGSCNFDTLADGQSDSASFRLFACTCEVGWDGKKICTF